MFLNKRTTIKVKKKDFAHTSTSFKVSFIFSGRLFRGAHVESLPAKMQSNKGTNEYN